jgi:hypothetical protein
MRQNKTRQLNIKQNTTMRRVKTRQAKLEEKENAKKTRHAFTRQN